MAGTTIDNIPQQISDGITALGQELAPQGVEKLARLLDELARWNARINLTAIR